ncbi:diguanylate cyclase [Methylibium sp.]|uniref:diguanylate cyclase n=1 Tax=Methylibium sp. TaxID=2067992 RepID=UPI001850F02F|nr:diguanylate cyclase [Methylibium sp.]MBA3591393.1 diguanylate cyclase [Methylibium sp.]
MSGNDNALPAAVLEAIARAPRLLVVDDQPINIQALYQTFASDHQVFMATSGEQALAVCREQQPDLVLLDVVMPGMDGYEVCTRLKADASTRDIPVIFVTAHNDEATETRALDVGAVDFISKPINPKVVRARVRTHITLKHQSDLLRRMAFIDGLTGVFNRRYFDERLQTEWLRAQRNGSELSVALIDVDFFKRYNDRYGHQAGDDCLRQVTTVLEATLQRPADVVARYGGEEFVCILPETGLAGALALAQRLERAVRALGIAHAEGAVEGRVSVSVGVACKSAAAQGDPAGLLAQADARLYAAKEAGRARVCGSEVPGSSEARSAV